MQIRGKQIKLFLNSEICDNYPEIVQLFLTKKIEYPSYNMKELNTYDPIVANYLKVNWQKILNESFQEWEITNYTHQQDNFDTKCELCGKKDIKNIAYITNIYNKKELVVGSTCITEFGDIKDNTGKRLSQYIKDGTKFQNELTMGKLINGFSNTLKNIDIINSSSVFKSKEYENNILVIKNLKKELNSLLEKRTFNEEDIILCTKLYNQVIYTKDQIENYINFSKSNIFGITKEIGGWLYTQKNSELLQQLYTDGKMNHNNWHYVSERNFLAKIVKLIFETNELIDIDLKKLDIENNSFEIVFTNHNFFTTPARQKIILAVDSRKFINHFRTYVFSNTTTSIDSLLLAKYKLLSVNDTYTKVFLINHLFNQLNSKKHNLIDIYDSLNEIVLYNKENSLYTICDFSYAVNESVNAIFTSVKNEETITNLLTQISKKSRTYTREQFEEYKQTIN